MTTNLRPGGFVEVSGTSTKGVTTSFTLDAFGAEALAVYIKAALERTSEPLNQVKGRIGGRAWTEPVKFDYRGVDEAFWTYGAATAIRIPMVAEVEGSMVREFPALKLLADLKSLIPDAQSAYFAEEDAKKEAAKKAGVKIR